MAQRKHFAFRFDWSEKIAHLSPEVRLEIYEATVVYAQTGVLPEMSAEALEAFDHVMKPDFERRRKAADYRRKIKENKNADAASESTVSQQRRIVEGDKNANALPQRESYSERRKLKHRLRREKKKSVREKNKLKKSIQKTVCSE